MRLNIKKMNNITMKNLINCGFIQPIHCSNLLFRVPQGNTKTETIYECNEYGDHKLMAVGVNVSWPKLFHVHPNKEDVFLFTSKETKPLYFVFAYDSLNIFEEKLRKKILNENDFIVVEMLYNNPKFSYFTVNENILHGEYTVRGNKKNPVFFVTESSNLPIRIIDLKEYKKYFLTL